MSMGVYVLSRRALDLIPPNTSFGFDELMLKLMEIGSPAWVKPFSGYWLDIGCPDEYEKACKEVDQVFGES